MLGLLRPRPTGLKLRGVVLLPDKVDPSEVSEGTADGAGEAARPAARSTCQFGLPCLPILCANFISDCSSGVLGVEGEGIAGKGEISPTA